MGKDKNSIIVIYAMLFQENVQISKQKNDSLFLERGKKTEYCV